MAFDGLFCFISVFLDLGSLNLSMMKSNKLKRVRERKKREWRYTGFTEKECICEIKERVGALVVLKREGEREDRKWRLEKQGNGRKRGGIGRILYIYYYPI